MRHLEKQLRAVDRAAAAGDLATYLTTLSEAVASHNTVAENCETLAQLPSRGLPPSSSSMLMRLLAEQPAIRSAVALIWGRKVICLA